MQKIRCVVERITYQNPENGYSVLKCRVKDYSDLIPIIGNLIDANVGSVLIIDGDWKVDAKYGRQFVAENWEETLPLFKKILPNDYKRMLSAITRREERGVPREQAELDAFNAVQRGEE